MTTRPTNYETAQRHADHVADLTPAELEAGKMYALLAVADELKDLNAQLASVIGRIGGGDAHFIRVFDEAP